MAWVKLDDGFGDHPKVEALIEAGTIGEAAGFFWVRALCRCGKHGTDGFVSQNTLARLHPQWRKRVEQLLAVGLMEQADGGVIVHDYLDWQPSAEELRSQRERTREKVAAWRNRPRNPVTKPVTSTPSNPVTLPVTNGVRNEVPRARAPARDPVPSRPVPSQDLSQDHHASTGPGLTPAELEAAQKADAAARERRAAAEREAAPPARAGRDGGLQRGDFSLKKVGSGEGNP